MVIRVLTLGICPPEALSVRCVGPEKYTSCQASNCLLQKPRGVSATSSYSLASFYLSDQGCGKGSTSSDTVPGFHQHMAEGHWAHPQSTQVRAALFVEGQGHMKALKIFKRIMVSPAQLLSGFWNKANKPHTCNPSTGEAKARGSPVCHPQCRDPSTNLQTTPLS